MTMKLPSETEVEEAWRRAKPAPGHDPRLFRVAPDIIQSIIRRDKFNQCGEFGWRIALGKPISYHKTSIKEAIKLVQFEARSRSRTAKQKSNNKARN